jgi:hypothetical protein
MDVSTSRLPWIQAPPPSQRAGVYKEYVGQYDWHPLDQVETVSVKHGKLWTDFGENMDEEYFPSGSETFS